MKVPRYDRGRRLGLYDQRLRFAPGGGDLTYEEGTFVQAGRRGRYERIGEVVTAFLGSRLLLREKRSRAV